MNEREEPGAGRQDTAGRNRQVAQAVAERELGRRRLNAATVGVAVASVAAAGAIIAVLPGSSHAATVPGTSGTTQNSNTGQSSDTGSGSSDSTSSTGDQGGLQQPSNSPQVVIGGGRVNATSGGS